MLYGNLQHCLDTEKTTRADCQVDIWQWVLLSSFDCFGIIFPRIRMVWETAKPITRICARTWCQEYVSYPIKRSLEVDSWTPLYLLNSCWHEEFISLLQGIDIIEHIWITQLTDFFTSAIQGNATCYCKFAKTHAWEAAGSLTLAEISGECHSMWHTHSCDGTVCSDMMKLPQHKQLLHAKLEDWSPSWEW